MLNRPGFGSTRGWEVVKRQMITWLWLREEKSAPGWSCEAHPQIVAVKMRVYLQRLRRRAQEVGENPGEWA